MLNKLKKSRFLLFGLLLAVSLLCLNIVGALLFSSHKGDFTDNGRYSLSPASRKIIAELNSPVYIRIYLSSALTKENPQYANYATFVLRFLKKYQDLAGTDKIRLEIKSPEPYSAAENEAKEQGMKPLLDNGGQSNLYFGAVFSNDLGESYAIPNFMQERSTYLENDISRILYKINSGDRPSVGLVSPQLPLITHQYGQAVPNWAIVAQLQNDYNVVELSAQTPQIPANIEALIVVNPQKLSPLFAYALDQYVIRGGKLLLILDAYGEKQAELFGTETAGVGDYNQLLNNWGISFDNQKVIGDLSLSELQLMNTPDGQQYKNYPFWMLLSEKQINRQHPLTAGLKQLRIKSPGSITLQEKAENIEITPLLATSAGAGSVESQILSLDDKNEIASRFQGEQKTYDLAVLIKGKFDSLFSDNPLKSSSLGTAMLSFLPHSVKESEIIVIADSDLIVAENWADTTNTVNNPVYGTLPVFNNGDFLLKSVDYLTGRHPVLGLNAKNATGSLRSVGENIYSRIFNAYAPEYNQRQSELQFKRMQLADIEQNLAAKKLSLTADVMKLIEQNRNETQQLQEKLKYIEYRIKQENANQLNAIIMLNLVFIPLILIFGLALTAFIIQRRHRRKVREMFNESANA